MLKNNFFFCFFLLVIFGGDLCAQTDPGLLKEYLLPEDHPLQEKLIKVFKDPNLFKSPDHFHAGGFFILPRVHRGLMVAGHPDIKHYLFKKFTDKVPQGEQLENFMRRIKGARALSKFIEVNHLKHIVVPQKWLYPLPKQYSKSKKKAYSYILVVEDMDICPGGKHPNGEVARRYAAIDKETLEELCLVVYHFRGLDSMLHNLPFTHSNKITFIDTERWEGHRENYLRHVMPFLSKENRDFANKLFKQFAENKMPFLHSKFQQSNERPNAS